MNYVLDVVAVLVLVKGRSVISITYPPQFRPEETETRSMRSQLQQA